MIGIAIMNVDFFVLEECQVIRRRLSLEFLVYFAFDVMIERVMFPLGHKLFLWSTIIRSLCYEAFSFSIFVYEEYGIVLVLFINHVS